MKTHGLRIIVLALVLALGITGSTAWGGEFAGKVKESMAMLKDKLNANGAPKLEGMGTVAGKPVPVMFFGSKQINGKYDVVDEVKKSMGGTATVFVKSGDEFVRVSTNVMKDAESRAVGTPLARNAAYEAIKKGEAFYGVVDILGKSYETGYEPIKTAQGEVIGIYYVGYMVK